MGEARAARGDRNNAAFDENFLPVGECGDIFAIDRDVDVARASRFRALGEIGFEASYGCLGRCFKISEIMLVARPMNAEATGAGGEDHGFAGDAHVADNRAKRKSG